ncbi:hypothetical protein SNARM312S_06990 [Streptomyces narbonensis]
MPCVWFRSWRTVTLPYERGISFGRYERADRSRSIRPSAASWRTVAAVKTFVTEPARKRAAGSAGEPLSRSRTPELPCQEPSVPPTRTSAAVASARGRPAIAADIAASRVGSEACCATAGGVPAAAGTIAGPAATPRTRAAASSVRVVFFMVNSRGVSRCS